MFLDPDVIFQASLSCGHLLLSSDLVSHKPSVMGMLQNGRTLMAIATLMYAPVPLEEVCKKCCTDYHGVVRYSNSAHVC